MSHQISLPTPLWVPPSLTLGSISQNQHMNALFTLCSQAARIHYEHCPDTHQCLGMHVPHTWYHVIWERGRHQTRALRSSQLQSLLWVEAEAIPQVTHPSWFLSLLCLLLFVPRSPRQHHFHYSRHAGPAFISESSENLRPQTTCMTNPCAQCGLHA